MAFKIGFNANKENAELKAEVTPSVKTENVRKSLVDIYFPKRNMTLTYYNDSFELEVGDMVFVDGKLEGLRGRVVGVNYNFKIKMSDYKRVISKVDADVSGQFFMAGSHFITFDSKALPAGKVVTWFKAPAKDDEEFVSGSDDDYFILDNLNSMGVSYEIAERGHDYYMDNRVVYISLDGCKGYAIVEGSKPYEVEFEYEEGDISKITCDCFCSYKCKHEFAAMLQLKDLLKTIEENYSKEFEESGYFSAIGKGEMFRFAIDGKKKGSFVL